MDARHASGLFTIQGELEDPPSRLGWYSDERRWVASVCSSFSTIPGFPTLPRASNTAWLNATSLPELTTITYDDSSDPMIDNRATQRQIQ